jgi:hypothetical protein
MPKDGGGNKRSNAPGFGSGNGSGPKQFGPKRTKKVKLRPYGKLRKSE